jgi:hypothetical protein
MDPDSDDDGLSDGRELMPFEIVSTSLGWEAARLAAIAKGGKLAVLNTQDQQDRLKAAMLAAKVSGKFWVGGHDTLTEGQFRWLTSEGQATASGVSVAAPTNWQQFQPSNLNDADGMEVSSEADFKWAMAPVSRTQAYVVEYPATDPNNSDSDGDGYRDDYELANASKPNDANFIPTYTLTLGAITGGNGTFTGGNFTITANTTLSGNITYTGNATGFFTFTANSTKLGHGANATLTATAEPGYLFGSWAGDASGNTTSTSLSMNGNKTVGASFVQDLQDSDNDGFTNFDESVTFAAIGGNSSNATLFPVRTFTLSTTSNGTITGNYTFSGAGNFTSNGTIVSGNNTLPHGSSLTLTANATRGYKLQKWSDNSTGATLSLTLNNNQTVGATFTPDNTTDADGDGLTDYQELVTHLTNPDSKDTDGDGLEDKFEIDNGTSPNDRESVPTYTLTRGEMTGNGTISGGNFTFTGNATVTGAFTFTGNSSATLKYGSNVTLTPAPDSGYQLGSWSGDASTNGTLTITGNKTVGATFVPDMRDGDSDGLTNYQELVTYGTNPAVNDTDADGLFDGAEVNTHKTDPNVGDTDGDGVKDGLEVNGYKWDGSAFVADATKYKTDPLLDDSDGDGYTDAEEVKATPATNPNDPSKMPGLPKPVDLADTYHKNVSFVRENQVSIPSGFLVGPRP